MHQINWQNAQYVTELEELANSYENDEVYLDSIKPMCVEDLNSGVSYAFARGEIELNNFANRYFRGCDNSEIEAYLEEHNVFFEKCVRRIVYLLCLEAHANRKSFPFFVNPWCKHAYERLSKSGGIHRHWNMAWA